VKHFKN